MPFRNFRLLGFAAAASLLAALLMLPGSDSFAATAIAVYRGDAPAASGPGRRIELRLKSDGTTSWITDYRNHRAPVREEGRWYPISTEEFDVIIDSRDGKPVNPSVIRFVKQGDTLHTTPESAARFGSRGLQLKQFKSAATPAPATVIGPATPVGMWHWEGQIVSGDKLSVAQPDRYTLEIQPGGRALVRSDCNRGQAAYILNGRGISIKVGAMTKAACAPGSLSDRYRKALESAVSQRIKGDNLYLDLPVDGGSMKFVRAK